MRKYHPTISIFLALIIINLALGCAHDSYKMTGIDYRATGEVCNAVFINQMLEKEKYFVIHQGNSLWYLDGASLSKDESMIYGVLKDLPDNYLFTPPTKSASPNIYVQDTKSLEYEVHFYISNYTVGENDQINIEMSSILKVVDYSIEKNASAPYINAVIAVGTVLIVGGLLFALWFPFDFDFGQ